jgi:hypothetical protein
MHNKSSCAYMARYFARSPCCYLRCYNSLLYRKVHRSEVYNLNRTTNTGCYFCLKTLQGHYFGNEKVADKNCMGYRLKLYTAS